MDTLDHNKINHTKTKAIEFDHIVHGTIKKLNKMHSKTTTHTTSNNSSRCISSNGSNHDNQTKEEVNNNNQSSSSLIETNAKDFNARQNGVVEQNGCAKTNGYVNDIPILMVVPSYKTSKTITNRTGKCYAFRRNLINMCVCLSSESSFFYISQMVHANTNRGQSILFQIIFRQDQQKFVYFV